MEAEKILGKPLLKEKQERVQRIGSWDRANRVVARFGLQLPALPSLREAEDADAAKAGGKRKVAREGGRVDAHRSKRTKGPDPPIPAIPLWAVPLHPLRVVATVRKARAGGGREEATSAFTRWL